MTHALLDNLSHRALRLHTQRTAAMGDARMAVLALPEEFRALQAHYPIVFQRVEGGGFQPVALFGLREGENLFLTTDGRWDAPVLPMALEREPFLIGRDGDELLMHIDLDSPRIVRDGEGGSPLFLPHGGHSELLDHASTLLQALHAGLERLPAFIAALMRHELLEPFALDIAQQGGGVQRLAGLHTIHEGRLAALRGEALEELHREGHLEAIYMVLASMSRLGPLIERGQR